MLKSICALSFALSLQTPLIVYAYEPIINADQAGSEVNNKVFKQIEKSEAESNRHLSWRDAVKEGDRRLNLQELDLAEGCFRQALRQVKKDIAATAEDRAMVEAKLAALLQSLAITDEALPLYKKAVRTIEKARGKSSPELIPYLLDWGGVAENDGDYKDAQKLFDRAWQIASVKHADANANANADADAYVQARCLHATGHLAAKLEENGVAEKNYDQSLMLLLRQKALPDGVLLDSLIADYSDLLEKNYARAKNLTNSVNGELLKDKLQVLSQKQGVPPSHFESEVSSRLAKSTMDKIPEAALSPNPDDQGAFQPSPGNKISGPREPFDPVSKMGIDQQKISFYERMVAVDIKSLGPDHPSVARDLSGLSAFLMASGQYDQAKVLLMRALKIYEKVYGSDSALAARTRAMLELVNENQTTAANGSESGNNFIADLPTLPLAAQKIDTAIRLNYLASLLYNLGKIAEAERLYNFVVADIYYASGGQNLLMAAGLIDYARVLRSSGNAPRATLLEGDARAIRVRVVSKQLTRAVKL